jgi:NAD(P)-dependent dehydrogenase (short-subunit alcohol dehydrogenase family)
MTDALTLTGKRVLITGGAGGVGAAVAERMVAAGAHALVSDRNERDLETMVKRLSGGAGRIDAVASDLSDPAGIARMFDVVDDRLGGLDILVACAGVGSGPLMEMDDIGWRYVIESNLASYLACARGAIERFRAGGRRDCTVILIGSISVHIKAVGESVYNAAKGGVASFAETLRKELMHEHIRVTLIEPGAIGSAMQPYSAEECEQFMNAHQMLRPAAVADAILFAATRPAGVDVVTLRIEPQIQKIR